MKSIKIKVINALPNQLILSTEEQGKDLYDVICYLLRNINNDEYVEIDFENVKITSYLFLRYSIAVFVHKYASEYLNQKLKIINIDDYWKKVLKNEVAYQKELITIGYTYQDGKCIGKDKNFSKDDLKK